jgi:hypothetical protein
MQLMLVRLSAIGCVWLAAITAATPSRAQSQVFLEVVEELAGTKVGQVVVEEVVGSSTVARTVLTELGIPVQSSAEAGSQFAALTKEQQALALVQSQTMGNILLSKLPDGAGWDTVSSLNTLRFTTAEALPKAATRPYQPFFTADILAGEGKLRRPFVFCSTPSCELIAEKLKFPSAPTAAVGGCALMASCRNHVDQITQQLQKFIDQDVRPVQPVASPPPRSLDWVKCNADQHWCSFERVDISGVRGRGVYVVWHVAGDTQAADVVTVGYGDIATELIFERLMLNKDQRPEDLRVTWALASDADLEGIKRYLWDKYHPTSGSPPLAMLPIAVNLP